MVYKMELADITEIGLDEVRFGPGTIPFDKLHGNGNDFMLIDEIRSELVSESMKAAFAVRCCRRNFGVGADGVLFLVKSDRSDIGMRLFQPDGSEAEMCGNGIRCLAKYAWSAGYVGERFSVETLAGIIPVEVREVEGTFWARVEMGTPHFDRPSIPALGEGEVVMEAIGDAVVSAVNTGVPHAVIIVDDLDVSLMEIAAPIRHCSLFPLGTNVNLVKVGSTLEIRTFERGVEGETFSCGTGAVASAAVARRLGLIGEEVLVETKGGPLIIYFEGEEAFMEGPAVTVFSGQLSEEYQRSLWQEL